MNSDPLCELFSVQMTQHEKRLLQQLAYEQGATMSGFVRKLIRDAGAAISEAQRKLAKEGSENGQTTANRPA